MQFQVPQFIEVEDKIFGPLTIRQFIYIAGGLGGCALLYFTLPLYIAILLMAPVAGLAAALAFLKINNRPFVEMMEAAVMYTLHSKLYIWRKVDKVQESKRDDDLISPLLAPKLSDSKLKDLAWSLDVSDKTGSESE
jgi:hypothetical protein